MIGKIRSWLRSKVQYQIAVIIATAVLFASLANAALGVHSTSDALETAGLAELESNVSHLRRAIEADLRLAGEDLNFLLEVPPVQGLLRANGNGGVDPRDGSTSQQWRNRLTTIFKGLLRARPDYMKVRYLLADGMEAAAAQRDEFNEKADKGDKDLKIVDEQRLMEVLELNRGELFASQMYLRRDQSDRPLKPLQANISYAVPVYGSRPTAEGILLITLDAGPLLQSVIGQSDRAEQRRMLLDHRGQYLAHSDASKTWGFELGHSASFASDYPAISAEVTGGSGDHASTADRVFAYTTLHPAGASSGHQWTIVESIPESVLLADVTRFEWLAGLLLLATLILTILLCVLVVRRSIAEPIRTLRDAANLVAEGELDAMVSINKIDEIGSLSRSFNEMVNNIARSAAELQVEKKSVEYKVEQAVRRSQEQQHYLQRSVALMLSEMEKFADGNLMVHLEAERPDDEIGRLYQGFNRAVGTIRAMLLQVRQAVAATSSAAAQIRAATDELAAGSGKQSDQAADVARAVDEIAQSIADTAANASQTAIAAEGSGEVASQGSAVVRDTVSRMHSIAGVVKQSSQMAERLAQSSAEIGTIVEVIDDIADQTNLLALNASIEAARAGDQGRGFAVVADEVRKLAERSTAATKQIGAMIETIQHETKSAVSAMNQGSSEVEAGTAMAEQAGKSLDQIVSEAQGLVGMINRIARASEDQSATSEEISRYTESISTLSQEAAGGSAAIAGEAENLSELTTELGALVERFRIEESVAIEAVWRAPHPAARNGSLSRN